MTVMMRAPQDFEKREGRGKEEKWGEGKGEEMCAAFLPENRRQRSHRSDNMLISWQVSKARKGDRATLTSQFCRISNGYGR